MIIFLIAIAPVFRLASCHPAASQDSPFCYANEAHPYLYFSTKTSYNYVKNVNTDPITIPGCKPIQMWQFSRHGSDYPKNDLPRRPELQNLLDKMPVFRNQVLENHRAGRGHLCAADVANLELWTINIPVALGGQLSPAGHDDHFNLGARYKARLPSLLDRQYNETDYVFRFTTASRTEDSCRSFNRGIWGHKVENTIKYTKPSEKDTLIRFYKACTKWYKEVWVNPDSVVEMDHFMRGPEITQMVAHVNDRLGYTPSTSISLDDVQLIWTMCRYDKALNYNNTSPWCAAFSKPDHLVLEYLEDLESYYHDGYGHLINVEQACNPVVDLLRYFNSTVTGKTSGPLGVFYFSHHDAISKLQARFGLFDDAVRPTATNYASQADRKWRSSMHINFAANMVYVLFRCDVSDYKVQLYVNERLTKLPYCAEETCLFSEFRAGIHPITSTCDFDKICGIE